MIFLNRLVANHKKKEFGTLSIVDSYCYLRKRLHDMKYIRNIDGWILYCLTEIKKRSAVSAIRLNMTADSS